MKTSITYVDNDTVSVSLTLSLGVLLKTIEQLEKAQKPHYRPCKLSMAQQLDVQRLYAQGMSQKELSVRFGVSRPTISRITRKKINATIQ